jgi:hypothetical protein
MWRGHSHTRPDIPQDGGYIPRDTHRMELALPTRFELVLQP